MTIGGPSFVNFGGINTPIIHYIDSQSNSGFYPIMNLQEDPGNDNWFVDMWVLTSNLTIEEQETMEEMSYDNTEKCCWGYLLVPPSGKYDILNDFLLKNKIISMR